MIQKLIFKSYLLLFKKIIFKVPDIFKTKSMYTNQNQTKKKLKSKSAYLLLFLVTPILIFSQKIEVKGTVSDESSKSILPSVNVVIKNTKISTTTDQNGKYKISANQGEILVFSTVGYKTIERTITGTNLNVSLQETSKTLEDVVVIGYGTSRKKDLTGSVASLNAKDFQKAPVTNVEGLIANKLPGVQIVTSSGKPGAGAEILIRGGASLGAKNNPLIVIDGVPIENSSSESPGLLSQLNPNDIENFTVLKDASAAAIYGSRASNGVIIITTKKGTQGKTKFNVSKNSRVSSIMKQAPVLSSDQYRKVVDELIAKDPVLFAPSTAPGTANTNWQDEIYQLALASETNFSASGAIDKLPFRISLGYLDQNGVLKTGNYKRLTASLNLSPKFFDNHLKVNLNLKGSFEDERAANEDAIWSARIFDPTQPVYVKDQTYGGYFQYNQYPGISPSQAIKNPLSLLEQVVYKTKNLRSVGNLQLDYSLHFLPDLHFNVNVGYDISKSKKDNSEAANFYGNLDGGYVFKANPSREVNNSILDAYLFYSKELKAIKSKIDFTGGYSFNNFLTTDYNYPTYFPDGTKKPNSDPVFLFDKPSYAIISFYGRLNYNINDKYLFTGSVRTDGSSRFLDENRWGIFPSGAFAWKIKEEKFLKDSKVISDLKLRIGYGITGQQDIDKKYNYYTSQFYDLGKVDNTYTFGDTAYTTAKPSVYNPNLKWEQTASANIGLDFGFLKNRITGSIDVYSRKTNDLITESLIPEGLNFGDTGGVDSGSSTSARIPIMLSNIGEMENQGIEFVIKAIPIQTKNISWDVNFNVTYNENKITKLSNLSEDQIGLFGDDKTINTVGFPRRAFFLYHQVYNENGMPILGQMRDLNNDGITNVSDKYLSDKSSLPKFMFGFSTNFQYKKWTLSTAFHANLGNYLFNQPQHNTIAINEYIVSQNLNELYYDSRFHYNNPNQWFSDFYLQNASFLKMDNINIAYDFGKCFNSSVSITANASVQNVFILTKFDGLDPESLKADGTENGYPVPRIFGLGLNLNF